MPDDQLGLFAPGAHLLTESRRPVPDDVRDFMLSGQQTSAHIDTDALALGGATTPILTRRASIDIDARRACPVCKAAPGQRCYQHCEANRPG